MRRWISILFSICSLFAICAHASSEEDRRRDISYKNGGVENLFAFEQFMEKKISTPTAKGNFCGKFDYFSLSPVQVRELLEKESLAVVAGKTPIECGVPGEDAKICRKCVDKPQEEDWEYARNYLAQPNHREWHFNWHESVNSIPVPNKKYFEQLKRWMLASKNETELQYQERLQKNRGENFLFMHRQMIKMLHVELTAVGKPCIAPWKSIPKTALDPLWPIPEAVVADEEDLDIYKSQMQSLHKYEKNFHDINYLKSVSLDKMGSDIQGSIHIMLHTVYQASKADLEKNCQGDQLKSPTCNDLGDNRSSHVNLYFWKLHGMLDNLIGDWLQANNYDEISLDCAGRAKCYQWKGTYLGEKAPGSID